MLNRLYIVIGIIAILVLGAAFIVPRLIPWADYRERMELLAGEALGTRVSINGDIRFALLPAPHLELTDVTVGPPGQPVVSVGSAEADFSLMDFLRDHYSVTHLVLDHPVLQLRIDAAGKIETGLKLAASDRRTSLSVEDARITGGALRVVDAGAGRTYAVDDIAGDLSLGAIGGPFGFSGTGRAGSQRYGVHVTTGTFNVAGDSHVSLQVQPDGNAFSLDLDGTLSTAGAAHLAGNLQYRQAPLARDTSGLAGDLTFSSKLDATAGKIVLGNFTLIPDENRAITRLTGSTTIELGKTPNFAATVSSGVLALPPRDATTEQGPQPYELVRLLGELPVVPVPVIPGTIALDASQLDLRSVALENVTLKATTDAKVWSIESFSGRLPGNARLALAGELSATDGRPSFAGTLAVSTERLDTLATLWRKPAGDNPLFNMPGSFRSKVSLSGRTMAFTDGQLRLDGTDHALTALIKFGPERRIDLSGQFKTLSANDTAALLALVPDVQHDPSAAVTFPEGALSLSADSASLAGLDARGLEVEGKWGNGAVELSKVAVADLGGAGIDVSLALSGTLDKPRFAGDGRITLGAGGGPALDRLFDALGTPQPARKLLARSLPIDLKAHLDDPGDNGAQGLSLSGRAGAADVSLVVQLDGGLAGALGAPIEASLDVQSSDPRTLTSQLGLGDVSLLPETGPMKLTASLAGPPTGTLKAGLKLTGGGDSIAFDGTLAAGDLSALAGSGTLQVALSDSSVLAADAGVAGLATPPVAGRADLSFAAGRSIHLDRISGVSAGTAFSGRLALDRDARGAVASGDLVLDKLDVSSLVAALGGPTSLLTSAGRLWPDGPLSTGETPRATTGSIAIKVPAITLGDRALFSNAGFDFYWDATHVGVRDLTGGFGGGSVALGVEVCCAGPVADKQVTGNVSIKQVPVGALLPPASAAVVSGTIAGSAQFEGTGDSLESMLGGLSGEGAFTLTDLNVQHFDPGVFRAVAAIGDLVDLEPAQLGAQVASALDKGPFASSTVGGGFTIAGGVLRAPNVAAQTPDARLFGSATLRLSDMALGGAFSLSPVGTLDAAGIVSETTSRITANLSGTLSEPSRSLDIAGMVDAIKMKALEVEVARLEALKEQDDARARAAAAARKDATEDAAARELADQQAQAAAEAAARRAAAQAAEKAAEQAAAAAKKKAEEAAQKKAAGEDQSAPPPTPAPFDLLPPLDLNGPSPSTTFQ